MSYGFTAVNKQGQVLVSSDTKNLHFFGKAVLSQTVDSNENFGGLAHWVYTITCIDYPTPFFTSNGGCSGITSIKLDGSTWQIHMVSTVRSPPEVYVFTPMRSIAVAGNYGVVVYGNKGDVSFDSRAKPLSIYEGFEVAPPSNPRVGAFSGEPRNCGSSLVTLLQPDNATVYNFNLKSTNDQQVKFIFHYASIAQAEREQEFTTGRWGEGGVLDRREYELWSTYWCFYRSGIEAAWGGNSFAVVKCGWVPVNGGCHSRRYESGRSFAGITVSGGGESSGGSWPYNNETLNVTPVFLMIADARLYD